MIPAIIEFLSRTDFLVNFWASLLSSLLVAGFLSIIALLFTNLFRSPRPNLILVAKQKGTYHDAIRFEKLENGKYVAEFQLAIQNKGRLGTKEGDGFWHTYIETEAAVTPLTATGEANHQRGLMDYPVYPNYFVDITNANYRLTTTKEEAVFGGVPYFFATTYGYFPKHVKLDRKTGQVKLDAIGLLKFAFPD